MSSCSGYLYSTAHLLLAAHLGKIDICRERVRTKQFVDINMYRFGRLLAVEESNNIRQMFKAIDLNAVYNACFVGVFGRQNHSAETVALCRQSDRQTAVYGSQMAVE